MAKPEHVNIKATDPLMDQESFSELMGHLLKWAKAEDFNPSVQTFITAIEPIYGPGQNTMSVLTHLTRLIMILTTDPRFKIKMNPDFLQELLVAPWRFKIQEDGTKRKRDPNDDLQQTTMTLEYYMHSLVVHVGNLLRNSPTGQLNATDFTYKFDPVVLALMRYVKKNGSNDITVRKLGVLLEPVYGHIVDDLVDLTKIVGSAYLLASQEPAFQLPDMELKDHLQYFLTAPVSGPYSLLGFGRRYTDLRKVEDFYIAMIKYALGYFAVAKVDWCMDNFKDLHDKPKP